MTRPLDTRPARKLHSREVAKILGALRSLATGTPELGAAPLCEPELLRAYLRFLADERFLKSLSGRPFNEAAQRDLNDAMEEHGVTLESMAALPAGTCRLMGGFVGSLCQIAGRRAVQTALLWWADTDSAWDEGLLP